MSYSSILPDICCCSFPANTETLNDSHLNVPPGHPIMAETLLDHHMYHHQQALLTFLLMFMGILQIYRSPRDERFKICSKTVQCVQGILQDTCRYFHKRTKFILTRNNIFSGQTEQMISSSRGVNSLLSVLSVRFHLMLQFPLWRCSQLIWGKQRRKI